uniref:Uncharacterized protein n=1 Tax=Sphaerodactylus townsendi TaxID=933632 RepID=A0ACB8FUF4_9SAUR
MYPGICICLLLAVLATSSSGQQPSGSHNANPMISDFEQTLAENHRHARTPASGSPLKSALQVDGNMDHKAILEALLAKYLQQVRRGIFHSNANQNFMQGKNSLLKAFSC